MQHSIDVDGANTTIYLAEERWRKQFEGKTVDDISRVKSSSLIYLTKESGINNSLSLTNVTICGDINITANWTVFEIDKLENKECKLPYDKFYVLKIQHGMGGNHIKLCATVGNHSAQNSSDNNDKYHIII